MCRVADSFALPRSLRVCRVALDNRRPRVVLATAFFARLQLRGFAFDLRYRSYAVRAGMLASVDVN